jgi:hypothetical protein
MKTLRSRLSYANICATLALFLALGGGAAYAATHLAKNSVGTSQIRRHSITTGKYRPSSVGQAALGAGIREDLAKARNAGPAPTRIHFTSAGTPSATPQPVATLAGLTIQAACDTTEGLTKLVFALRADEAGTIQENFQNDSGANLGEPGPIQAGNIQISLPAGESILGGAPGVPSGTFFRTFATLIYSTPKQTASLQITAIADGTTAACTLDGTGVVATG